MSALKKARLGEIPAGQGQQQGSNWVDVQFNPTSLRIQISNHTAGGQQAGAQARQRPGTGEMQVSFDLVFDTADESSVSVLTRTAAVERFVRPRSAAPGQEAPPRVVFEWGSFQVQGTMESANLDVDFFDADGVPLRAKVAVVIKGQDPKWAYVATQTQPTPGASQAAAGAPAGALSPPVGGASGLPAGAPGTQGSRAPVSQVVQAMPGESLPQLAARMGLDPSAWRALSSGLDNPTRLGLGQEIALPTGLGQGTATGLRAQGQDPARSTARLALLPGAANPTTSAASAVGASGAAQASSVQTGQALAVQGGLARTITQALSQVHQQGAAQSRAAFGLGAADTAEPDCRPWGQGVPLRPRFGSGTTPSRTEPVSHNAGMAWRAPAPVSATASSAPRGRVSQTPRASAGCGCRGNRSRKA